MFTLQCVVSNTAIAALLAVGAALAGKITKRPQVRHALWILVLVKLVTPPLVRIPIAMTQTHRLETPAIQAGSYFTDVSSPHWQESEPSRLIWSDAANHVAEGNLPVVPDVENLIGEPPSRTGRVWQYTVERWPYLLLGIGGFGSCCWFVIAGMRLMRFRALLRHARPASETLLAEVDDISKRIGLHHPPRVLVVDAQVPPLIWSFVIGRPVMVLPGILLDSLQTQQRLGLIAHELAHLGRCDHWIRWFELVVLGIHWWNPLAWWARCQVQQAEEECCDAWALWAFPDQPNLYAQTLMDTVDFLADVRDVTPSTAITFHAGKSLKHRIELIMDNQCCRPLSWPTRASLMLLALAVAPLSLLAQSEEETGGAAVSLPNTASLRPEHDTGSQDREQSEIAGLSAAIENGVAYLRQTQEPDGSWKEFSGHPGGMTALCTLALLKSEVPVNDECVLRALKYLRGRQDQVTVYSTALQVLALNAAESNTDWPTIQKAVNWLQDAQIEFNTPGRTGGSWGYGKREGVGDNSNSYFAAMALSTAEKSGLSVDRQVWTDLRKHLLNSQNEDGSWGYVPRLAGTGSMTCGAIISLAASAKTCSNSEEEAECSAAINAGWMWLERSSSISKNPNSDEKWYYYYVDSLARAAEIAGRDAVGDHDWRREGATHVIAKQDKTTGAWKEQGTVENDPLISTSFALLFLTTVNRNR